MPQFQLPYEITKLFEIIEDPLTKEKTINIDKNYAHIIQDNFDQILKYVNEGISGENLTSSIRKRTISLIPQNAVLPTSNPPALTKITGTNNTYYTLDFDPDTDETCYWHFTMPNTWDNNNVSVYVKYIANTTSGNIIWGIYGIGSEEDENPDTSYETDDYIDIVDTVGGTSNYLNIAELKPASGKDYFPNIAKDNWVTILLMRNADIVSDTLTTDARVLEVVLEWDLQ